MIHRAVIVAILVLLIVIYLALSSFAKLAGPIELKQSRLKQVRTKLRDLFK